MATLLKTQYSICNSDFTEYGYFDQGDLCFDKKMPRRSGTVDNLDHAKDLKAKAEAWILEELHSLRIQLSESVEYVKKHPKDRYHRYNKEAIIYFQKEIDELELIGIDIVKITVQEA